MCDNTFHVSKKSTQRFCSTACQGRWQSTQTGILNPRRKRLDSICDYCGKKIDIIQCNVGKYEHNFCNAECRQKWYSEIFSQSEEWKEESKRRATKLLSENQTRTNTKPQQIINQLLDSMNVSYINEKDYVYYSVDNYLDDYNLIIEVMGDFWHCNPLMYSYNNIREIQAKRIPKDKAKHTYIFNNYGIEILYLWEFDINNNIDVCKELIEKYIENNGYLENYHSFNYSKTDDGIVLNKNIIIPFQEVKVA